MCKLSGSTKASNIGVAGIIYPIFPSHRIYLVIAIDPCRPPKSNCSVCESIIVYTNKKIAVMAIKTSFDLRYRTIMRSNKGLILNCDMMEYQHVLNSLRGQRIALILNHIDRYYWETTVISVGCHRIISEQHRKALVFGHPSNTYMLIFEETSGIFGMVNRIDPLLILIYSSPQCWYLSQES